MKKQKGQIIIIAIVFMAIFFTISTALIGYTWVNLKSSRSSYTENQILYLANAGLNKAINQLNQDPTYSGETNTILGNGTFTVTVSTIDTNTKRITSTGFVSTNLGTVSSRTVKATASINTADIAFNNGVQVGAGGLNMNNGSQVIGNVYSNGNITGMGVSSGGKITGDAIVAEGTPGIPDQQWNVQNIDFELGDINNHQHEAQSFVPSASGKLNKVNVLLKKIGSPGDITVRIMSDNSGQPSRSVLANTTINASLITSNYDFIEAVFSSQANLTAGTTYWLMLSSASIDNSNYFEWGFDSADGYGSGTSMRSPNWNTGSAVWLNNGGDLNFEAFVGGVLTYLDGVNVLGDVRADSLTNCNITKDAYYLTISSCTVSGTSTPGTAAPGPAPMPVSNAQITQWENTAASGGVISGNYIVSGTQTLGPIEIDGDLSFTNSASLKLSGPVWVKGNINIGNLATVQVDSSLGNAGTVLLADYPADQFSKGKIVVDNNANVLGNGNTYSFPLILTTNSSSDALDISNNSAGAIYYAANGTIVLSNNAGGNQITGYALQMGNNSTVSYTTGLQNALFSNGPGGSWAFVPGSYVIIK